MENLEICSKCGGKCCKKSGCDYLPCDFKDLSYKELLEKLNEGNISVVAALNFEKLFNGKIYATPFLYLRARNINREIIDLFTMKTTCSLLTEKGCKYNYLDRPYMGKNLIPDLNSNCYPLKDPNILINDWLSYQKTLSKIVKKMTGLTVEERLRNDIENLFCDILNENFEGVDKREILDIRNMLNYLMMSYPNELDKATNKTKIYTKL